MELNDIDLNLLVVFNQLLIDRRVSKVATSLGLSQPGVSNALARLRKLTGDALFLRTPKGMEPTPFAEQLAEPTARALQVIHGGAQPARIVRPGNVEARLHRGHDRHRRDLLPAEADEGARARRARRLAQHGAQHGRQPAGRDGGRPRQPRHRAVAATQGRLLPAPTVQAALRLHVPARPPLDKRKMSLERLFCGRPCGRGFGGHRPWPGGRASEAPEGRSQGAC